MLVGLTDRAGSQKAELSGGTQQRVGLARTYATDASILLMDEPFSALDPLIRDHLQAELLDHQKKLGCSIIFVSHDLDEAFRLGDRIAIMEGGRIVQIGTPREILHAPSTEYVANFVAQINPLSVLIAEDILGFATPTAKAKKGGQTISATTPANQIIRQLDQTEQPLSVLQNNKTIGQIDKSAVLACLAHFTDDRQ